MTLWIPLQFPWMLDMEPYTARGIEAREKDEAPLAPQMYELVGIVVHSGQASAGHYYSFIKEKRYIHMYMYVHRYCFPW